MKAEQFLRNGADVLAERGKEYDKPEGERSMARTVAALKAITGKELTEAEGWLFMECLKNVRQWQNPERYHEDSAVDGVNYSALKAEALSEQKPESIPKLYTTENGVPEEVVMREGKPDWKDAPEWAEWLGYDYTWVWFQAKPSINHNGTLIPPSYTQWHNTHIEESFGYSIHYMEPRP